VTVKLVSVVPDVVARRGALMLFLLWVLLAGIVLLRDAVAGSPRRAPRTRDVLVS
jgi:hypothetical protein